MVLMGFSCGKNLTEDNAFEHFSGRRCLADCLLNFLDIRVRLLRSVEQIPTTASRAIAL
jgi:hypothetical protein